MTDSIILGNATGNGFNKVESDLKFRILADYDRYLGSELWVTNLEGMLGGEPVELELSSPARVQVVPTPQSTLLNCTGNWCVPFYQVKLVTEHPQLTGISNLFIKGPGYHLNGEQTVPSKIIGFAKPIEPQKVNRPYRYLNVSLCLKFGVTPPETLEQLQAWIVSSFNQAQLGAEIVELMHGTEHLDWPDFLDAPSFGPEHPDYAESVATLKRVQKWLEMDRRQLIAELLAQS